jgi:3-oxoadipate enol-lactonase
MQREVNGITLTYDVKGDGPWLVFAHSLGMTKDLWSQQVGVFSQRYRVLTYDARGHGQSSKPPGPYSYELLGADLYELLTGLDITSAAVVGLSLGGNTAQVLAAQHPDLVKALVLSDTTVWYGPDGEKNWQARADDVRAKGLAEIIDFQLTRWFSDAFRSVRPDVVDRCRKWLIENDPAAYMEAQGALGRGDLRESTKQISCPTLITVGEGDYATPPAMAEDLHQRIAGSQLKILPGARHFSPIESAAQFNAVVSVFLSRVGY